jgi:hypothetical protein
MGFKQETRRIGGNAGAPTITVSGGSSVLYLQHVDVNLNGTDVGLHATSGGAAYLDEARLTQNTGGGLLVDSGAEAYVRNSFVGGDYNDVSAVAVDNATVEILYSTLVGGSANTTALSCTSPNAVEVRNSILVTRGGTPPDEVDCLAATITYSATEGDVAGMGNVLVGSFPAVPADWFVNLASGDFSLQNDGVTVFADIAQWEDGDPPFDIEGADRPNVDGAMDVAGADLP